MKFCIYKCDKDGCVLHGECRQEVCLSRVDCQTDCQYSDPNVGCVFDPSLDDSTQVLCKK